MSDTVLATLSPSNPMIGRPGGPLSHAGRLLAAFGVLAILLTALMTAGDIAIRWLSLGSLPGVNEVLVLGLSVGVSATFLAGAVGRVNLHVDVLAGLLTPAWDRSLHAIGALLLLAFTIILTWSMAVTAASLQDRNAITLFLHWRQAPFAWIVVALLVAASLGQAVVTVSTIRRMALTWRRPARVSGLILAAILLLLVASFGFGWDSLAESLSRAAKWSTNLTGLMLTAGMLGLALLMVPLTAAMGLAGFVGCALLMGWRPALTVLGSGSYEFLTNQSLAVLPFFLLTGALARVSGLADDIYRLAHVFFGGMKGGLAYATVTGCAAFGALSSSSIASSATIGQVVLPEMRRRGYAPSLATGVVAAGGTLAPLLSPGSGPLVVYALMTETSIGQLFIAAAVPGLLAVLLYWAAIWITIRLRPHSVPAPEPRLGWAAIVRAILQSWGVILLVGLVFGGIYSGVFTVTEAAAIGTCLTFGFTLARGRLSRGQLWELMAEVTATTAMIYLLLFGAVIFSFFVDFSGVPESITNYLRHLPVSSWVVLSLFVVFFLILGIFMESFVVILIVVPIVAPYISDMGFSLIWWGIVMVGIVETGLITPPLGLNVFILKNIRGGEIPTAQVFRGVTPFIVADLVRLALLMLFPSLVTWLPSVTR